MEERILRFFSIFLGTVNIATINMAKQVKRKEKNVLPNIMFMRLFKFKLNLIKFKLNLNSSPLMQKVF